MSIQCEFCKKFYASKQSLKNHQKTTKSCLAIQNELAKNDETIVVNVTSYDCKYCDKTFSSKKRLICHQNSCYDMFKCINDDKDKLIEQLRLELSGREEEISKLKEDIRVIAVETEVRILREQNERSTSTVEAIAKQPRIQQNTNNNQKILITSNMDLSQEKMKDMIENSFNANYMIQGQKGVARFAYDTMLKDEEGKLKYICTDPSRQIFQYKNEEGQLQKDVKAKKLTKALLDGELKSASHKIASDKMKNNTDDFLEYSTYYLEIKELEDDNSDFSKELSTLVI